VFGPGASQAELYHNIGRPLVEDVLGGYTGTILCYGQTGSGKTYTMIAPQVSVNT
jgi:Tfp pilus assembly pilus retraction ATPase PilT